MHGLVGLFLNNAFGIHSVNIVTDHTKNNHFLICNGWIEVWTHLKMENLLKPGVDLKTYKTVLLK